MIVVDTSALIAVLRHEEDAEMFLRIIAQARRCLLSAVSHLETSMVLAGLDGHQTAWRGFDKLIEKAAFQIVPHDAKLAEAAREAFLSFGKGRHPAGLNVGDCASYALAKTRGGAAVVQGCRLLGHRRYERGASDDWLKHRAGSCPLSPREESFVIAAYFGPPRDRAVSDLFLGRLRIP